MNWTELKIEGFKIIGELAKDDNVPNEQKLEALKTEVRPLLVTSLEGIIDTLPAGIKEAVKVVMDHGGVDFLLMFLVPLLAEELYQVWKMLHIAVPKSNTALTNAASQ